MAEAQMNSDFLELPHGTLAATRMSKDEVRLKLAVMF
jgi:hypothetical protein